MATYLSPETLVDELSADLFEITPAQPHSDADLNFHDETSLPRITPIIRHKRNPNIISLPKVI